MKKILLAAVLSATILVGCTTDYETAFGDRDSVFCSESENAAVNVAMNLNMNFSEDGKILSEGDPWHSYFMKPQNVYCRKFSETEFGYSLYDQRSDDQKSIFYAWKVIFDGKNHETTLLKAQGAAVTALTPAAEAIAHGGWTH